jgi:hypothetical protein
VTHERFENVRDVDLQGCEAGILLLLGQTVTRRGTDYRMIAGHLYATSSKLLPSSVQFWQPATLTAADMLPERNWRMVFDKTNDGY